MSIAWSDFLQLVQKHRRILLTSHIRPDCDALGSELGMAGVLESLGKQVVIVNGQSTPPNLAFIDPTKRIKAIGVDVQVDDLRDFERVMAVDLFGDWREELILRASDNHGLYVYTTTLPTDQRLFTLMHDPTYRLAVATQNVGYNQPPHTGFYLGFGTKFPVRRPNIVTPVQRCSRLASSAPSTPPEAGVTLTAPRAICGSP